jgi:hypothetical protein
MRTTTKTLTMHTCAKAKRKASKNKVTKKQHNSKKCATIQVSAKASNCVAYCKTQ